MKLMSMSSAVAALCLAGLSAGAQPVGGAAPSQLTTPATQTSSPPATPAGPPTTTKGTAPDQQIICKHEEEVGSRLGGKRVCMTKAQWAQQAQDARDATDGAQRSPH
jgi:hypothetical protein